MNTTATYPDKQFPDTLTFADALRFNDSELTEHLLRKGLQPNSCTADGKPLLLAAHAAHAYSVEWTLEKAGATEDFYTEEERQELRQLRNGSYQQGDPRSQIEIIREKMQQAESHGEWERFSYLRDRERELTRKKPVLNEEAFQTLLTDLKAAGIEVPDLDEWPENRRKPTSRAMAAMEILLKNGDAYWLKRLLDTGVNPNDYMYADDGYYELPLCEAIQCSPALVPLLQEYGADPSGDGEDCIPLIDAAIDEQKQMFLDLLKAGANPFVDEKYGWSPLFAITGIGWTDLVIRLLKLGVNPNGGDDNGEHIPLSTAIRDNNVEETRALLDAGASPFLVTLENIYDSEGQTPLYEAEQEVRFHAQFNEAEDKRARKHARRVLESIYERYPDIDRLPYPGEWDDPNADKTDYFNACLWNTAAYGLRRDAGYLLRYFGAAPNACNRAGIPALFIAAVRGHTETVYELLCYGATPELPPHLLTAAGGTGEVKTEIRQLIERFRKG